MSWTAYRVTFRLCSPLHNGWRKVGNLQQTRPYVTGRNLWGTLTARLVRDVGGNDYEKVGNEVNQQLAFSYFFATTNPERVTLWPWQEQWHEFAWTFMGSYASTALQEGHSAEDASLHETEFISPYTRDGEPVFLLGYICEKEGCSLLWKNALARLQLGGERGYGWGKVILHEAPARSQDCFRIKFLLDGVRPIVFLPKATPLFAHTIAQDLTCDGSIEPFLGRETSRTGQFGQNVSSVQVCWLPGSLFRQSDKFTLLPFGVWKRGAD